MPKIRVDDTLEMEYLVDDFTDPWKKADTLIMQHGCFMDPRFFYVWAYVLSRHFRVIRPALRGVAGSTRAPAGYHWSLDGFTSDLIHLLDALGLDRVHYVGASSGGGIGYGLAIKYPERMKTVSICGIVPNMVNHFQTPRKPLDYAKWVREDKQEEFRRQQALYQLGKFVDPDRFDQAMYEWHAREGITPKETALGILDAWSNLNLEPDLPKIRVPVLLICGERTTLGAKPEEMKHARSLIPGAKLAIIPGSVDPKFIDADKSAQEVLRFIREQETH